ncbi:leucine-rich repeat domain-containing protein [Anaerovibrio sp.]|uniref:leucine-rich repeat domain-containing protein n=1 Tax=Anaerovibrio sp. TaxID=1872532 RepID=UPI0025C633E8|nr:leucine-rich repeat domain-containing protein [Anaerovibrio sp.]MBR2142078.1 leucine-rich repeat domain-containing protein [Anaerovibrio sp.]
MDKNKEIILAIGKIINGYGGEMLSPYSRIKALLMDLLPKYSKERRLILTALSCGVGNELYNNRGNDGQVSNKARNSSKRFLVEAYVSEEAAEMVIEWIVAAFSVRESLPKPKQYEAVYEPVQQDFELSYAETEKSNNEQLPINTANNKESDDILRMREMASRFLSSTSKSNIIHDRHGAKIKFDTTGSIVLQGDLQSDSYVFEDGVTSIGEKAFANASRLESVTFTNDIIFIGKEAFANCTSLTNVVLLRNMKKLGEGIFKGCSSL